MTITEELMREAQLAAENAYAPYSKIQVGAVVQSLGGKLYRGCNIENASFGLTICAERAAIFNGVIAEGQSFRVTAFALIAKKNGKPFAITPCGACRQVLVEFATPNCVGMYPQNDGSILEVQLSQLLPDSFRLRNAHGTRGADLS